MAQFDAQTIKQDFPIFTSYPDLVYLDNAATSQKPQQIIEAVTKFYTHHNSNVHRGIYSLSQSATEIYEKTRQKVAEFIGTDKPEEIIFTGNASEAINLVAYGYARKYLKAGDYIVLSEMEHHSNIVPWMRLREEQGIILHFLPITKDFVLDYKSLLKANIPKKKIKLVALTHASNVLGTINPIKKIVRWLQENEIQAKILIDAAQSVPHMPVDVKDLGSDFLVFSSHKMLGPAGVGALWAKKELLESMDPFFVGSHMIRTVTKEKATWADLPDKFEVGTGRLEGVAGLGAAIDYLQTVGLANILQHETMLNETMLYLLEKNNDIVLYGPQTAHDRVSTFSFNLPGYHPHDVGEILNRHHICVRGGHHCAQPLMHALGVSSTVRASFYLYNTKDDIEILAEGLKDVKKILKK